MCEIKDLFVLILLILCSISDIRRRGVYTWILVAMSLLLTLYCIFYQQEEVWIVLGGIGVGLLFLFISRISREAIGYADSWLILLLGGYLGICDILILLTVAFVVVGLFGLVGLAVRRLKRASSMPFIPFLTIAYLGVILL